MKKSDTVLVVVGLLGAAIGISGCAGIGPTYGTDKSSMAQFLDDVGNIGTFGSLNKTAKPDTKPRPELVHPSKAEIAVLPAPQENVAKAGVAGWVESPEEKRGRLRSEATENQNNPNYKSPIFSSKRDKSDVYYPDGVDRVREREDWMPSAATTKQQNEEFRKRQKEMEGGDSKVRKYLSEPPLVYRQPASSAPVGEQGEDEASKERARNKAQGKKNSLWPF